jgi:putative transcriptional regulator
MTMVLQGSFSDEIDNFYRGDVELGDDNLTHTPKAGMDEHCICIAATEAPLVFNSWLPKLLQPFIRI